MWFAEVNFPEELVRAHRDGELVLFVGAGASMAEPSNLPRFSGVVEQVCAKAGEQADLDEVRQHPDVVLGRLGARGVDVHGLVADLISPPVSQPNDVHRAVVDLAMTPGCPRIVTTNWDRHLSTVLTERGWEGEVYRAPALPVGDEFEGLVYLHGSTTQPAKSLIMTDGDFGRAYLTDAWAARFMARLFTRFKTLFIGYSHDDVVMSYLAQGLRSGSPDRFALTDVPDSPRWRQLGIIPVAYSAAADHVALPTAIRSWAAAADRGALDHAQRIRQLISERQPDLALSDPDTTEAPLTGEEVSYLESVLTDPGLVSLFTTYAKGEAWLRWALTQSVFRRAFTDNSRDDACVSGLARWFASTYLGSEEDSNLALGVLVRQGGRLGAPLWWAVADRLSFPGTALPSWVDPWILLLVRDSGPNGGALLSYMLEARAQVRVADGAVLLLLDHLLRPKLSFTTSYRITDAPRVEVTLTGDVSTMAHVWEDRVKPALPNGAEGFLDVAEQHLVAAYQLTDVAGASSGEWDSLNYRRAAIERHPQNPSSSDGVDVLIDVARDAVEALLKAGDARVRDRVDRWVLSGRRLLRRLAIHAYGVRTDMSATARLAWLISSKLLYDINLRHETFQVVTATVNDADTATVDALTEHILGWPPFDGDNAEWYRAATVGDALAWLLRSRPDHEPSRQALADLHARFEFSESAHPDLLRWSEAGWVAVVPAIGVEDLHELVNADPADAVARLVEAEEQPRVWGLREHSVTEAVRALTVAHPRDGLAILTASHAQARRFTGAITEGLANAALEPEVAGEAAQILAAGPLAQHAHAIATLLVSSDRHSQSFRWTGISAARQLAAAVWTAAAPDVDYTGTPTLSDAINDAAGRLAQFWIQAAEDDHETNTDRWDGLTDDLTKVFSTLLGIETPEPARRLAQIVFAANVFALWTIDETWTQEAILPLLSWDDEQLARSTWAGYLTWGRWNDSILNAGLLDEYARAATVFSGEADDATDGFSDLRHKLADHVADICLNSSISLLAADGTGFLTDWTRAATPDIRIAWLDSIAWRLHGAPPEFVEQLWTSWLALYWTLRTQTAPEPLVDGEQSALVAIAAHLDESLPAAVDLALARSAPIGQHRDVLADLTSVRVQTHPEPVARLVAHMLSSTMSATWAVSASELQRIVNDLRAVTTADVIRPVIDAAITLFGAFAADW